MDGIRHSGRIALLAAAVLAAFTGIGVRLSFLHLKPDPWVQDHFEKDQVLEQTRVGQRGRISDCNGEILAMDMVSYTLAADPVDIRQYGDLEKTCDVLAYEFNRPRSELHDQLSNTNRSYVVIEKEQPSQRLRRFVRKGDYGVAYTPDGAGAKLLSAGETNVCLRGVWIEEKPMRAYPKGALMAHVVGFCNREGVGGAGIEQLMDEYLRGKPGLRVGKKDAKKHEIYTRRTVDVAPEDGASVELTLDQQLQYVVERGIEAMCTSNHAQAAWAIVQRVRTGEIMAMASAPTYDLNRYGKTPPDWRLNRAIGVNYEPGSTMKAATIAAAMDRRIVKETDIIDCENGHWVYAGKKLDDAHGEGRIPVSDVIKYSSNIGTAKIALMLGNQPLYDGLRAFGFGSRTGIRLPGEESGIFYPPGKWSKLSPTRIGMGHEIGVTSLQVLSMMDTIANEGHHMRPLLIRRVVAADGTIIEDNKPEEIGRPISSDTARRMVKMLVRVTEEGGTGTKAAVPGYTVAGKTGTAQKIRPKEEGGGYYDKRFFSSFVGFLPAENPEIGIIVVADDPSNFSESGRRIDYFGGTVCAPCFRQIAEFAVRYLRIPPEGIRYEHRVSPGI